MGNSLGSKKKTVKIMTIDGEMMKLKTPVQAREVVHKYPGYVLLDSEHVKHYGTRAKPLELQQVLEPKRLYFLVELPKVEDHEKGVAVAPPPRRVRSGIHMNAKDRLESLKLSRRSSSDLSLMKQTSTTSGIMFEDGSSRGGSKTNNNVDVGSSVRLKLRLPKSEVAKLMQDSKNEAEAAQKIMDICLANNNTNDNFKNSNNNINLSNIGQQQQQQQQEQVSLKSGNESQGFKKRVSFMPVNEAEMQLGMGAGPGIESW